MLYSILRGELSFGMVVMYILAVTITVVLILPFHELAHGFIAYKLGDSTAKREGRLTLNPLYHIDYVGALCLLLVGFGWAKPVPVNMRNFKNPRRDMALVALAGPAANLIAALAGAILMAIFVIIGYKTDMNTNVYDLILGFFEYYIQVNVGLAVFNLVPLPPLDGSKILGAFLPTELYVKQMEYERYLSIALLALLWLGIVDKVIGVPTSLIVTGLYTLIFKIVSLFV